MNQQEIIDQLEQKLQQANKENAQLKLALETQQNYIYTLIDAIPDLIFAKDTEARVILANKAVCDTAKATREEMLGTTPHDVYPEDLADVFLEKDLAVIRSGETDRNEEWITTLEGGRELIDTIKVPFKNPDGTIGGLIGVSRNITERYHLEQELKRLNQTLEQQVAERTQALQAEIIDRQQIEKILQENQQLLGGFVDNISAMVYAKDIEGRYLLINHKLADMLNHSVEELIGQCDYDFFPTEVADAMRAFDQEVFKRGAFEQEEFVVHPDGSEHVYFSVKFPLYDEHGTAYGVGGISTDITERKEAEIAVQRQAQFQEALLNHAPYAIIAGDSEGTIQAFNPAAERMLGYTAAELVGQTPAIFHDPAEVVHRAKEFSAELGTTIEPGFEVFVAKSRYNLPNEYQWTYIHKDGHRFPVLLSVAAMKDDAGHIVGFIGSAIDISEQKKMEAERERLQQEIIEAQQRAIQELSSPVIPLMEGIIIMPLIGSIDSTRTQALMRTLLQGISQYRAKIVILDITGVPFVDTGIAAHLDKTIQVARLKGSRTIITGMSDAVAETIVDLGIDWSQVETLRDLQTGLLVALDSLKIKLT